MLRTAVLTALAVGAVACGSSASAQVYKCTQAGGRVLYSDAPCKDGTLVDVRGGADNPAAVMQLARDNAAFDQRMAVRRVAEDEAEFRRQQLNAQLEMARAAESTPTASDAGPYYYTPGDAFLATPRFKRRMHSHHAMHAPERRVPATPALPGGVNRHIRR